MTKAGYAGYAILLLQTAEKDGQTGKEGSWRFEALGLKTLACTIVRGSCALPAASKRPAQLQYSFEINHYGPAPHLGVAVRVVDDSLTHLDKRGSESGNEHRGSTGHTQAEKREREEGREGGREGERELDLVDRHTFDPNGTFRHSIELRSSVIKLLS
jgi:hypothetical protein